MKINFHANFYLLGHSNNKKMFSASWTFECGGQKSFCDAFIEENFEKDIFFL